MAANHDGAEQLVGPAAAAAVADGRARVREDERVDEPRADGRRVEAVGGDERVGELGRQLRQRAVRPGVDLHALLPDVRRQDLRVVRDARRVRRRRHAELHRVEGHLLAPVQPQQEGRRRGAVNIRAGAGLERHVVERLHASASLVDGQSSRLKAENALKVNIWNRREPIEVGVVA